MVQHSEAWAGAQAAELRWWKALLHTLPQSREEFVAARLSEGYQRMLQFGLGGLRGRLLDVGCSPISVHEGREGVEVVAIDPLLDSFPPPFVLAGRVANVEYRCCQVYDVDDGPYDIVWCVNVLDHTDDWQNMIHEFYRLTASGGLLLIGVDVRCGAESDSPCHISIITPQELVDTIRQAGFTIEFSAPQSAEAKFYFRIRARKYESAPDG